MPKVLECNHITWLPNSTLQWQSGQRILKVWIYIENCLRYQRDSCLRYPKRWQSFRRTGRGSTAWRRPNWRSATHSSSRCPYRCGRSYQDLSAKVTPCPRAEPVTSTTDNWYHSYEGFKGIMYCAKHPSQCFVLQISTIRTTSRIEKKPLVDFT